MTRPNLTLLFEPRPFRTIFSTCGRTVRLIYVQVIVSILLSLYFSSTKSSLNWNIWKVVFFYEKLSTNVWRKDLQFRKLSSDFERSSHLAFFFPYTCLYYSKTFIYFVFSLKLSVRLLFCNLVCLISGNCKLATMSFTIIIITIYKKYF